MKRIAIVASSSFLLSKHERLLDAQSSDHGTDGDHENGC